MAVPIHITGLSDREACIDTFLRFTQGLDECNKQLIASSWTEDAVLDLTPMQKIGLSFGITSTRGAIVSQTLNGVGSMDSHHLVSNWRVHIQGNTAYMTGAGLAQHYPPTLGPRPEVDNRLLMANRYNVELRRAEDGLWRMSKLTISNGWTEGNLAVMMSH
jgi:hypothetical protein